MSGRANAKPVVLSDAQRAKIVDLFVNHAVTLTDLSSRYSCSVEAIRKALDSAGVDRSSPKAKGAQ